MGASERMQTAVSPHWGEVSIDDVYSDSGSGVRHYTMHILVGDLDLSAACGLCRSLLSSVRVMTERG